MAATRIAVFGATGRMGQAVVRAALARRDVEVCAALVRPQSPWAGEPLARMFGDAAPALEFSEALLPEARADVLVDFSDARAFDAALALAREHRLALVSGTTGLSAAQIAARDAAAASIPVLWAANFSFGVAVLRRLAAQAASLLPDGFDVEIVETHHRHKQDAPSGTALVLGRAIADARRQAFEEIARFARHGQTGPRGAHEIGFAVIRAADVVGEHTVIFAAAGERLELTHRAGSREVFAGGAVLAARWLAGQPPGAYDIADVLG